MLSVNGRDIQFLGLPIFKCFVKNWHKKKLAANPFKFGNPVEGDFYLPRPDLTTLMRQFLENRIHIVLMGPRRFGKTSFVLNLLNRELVQDTPNYVQMVCFQLVALAKSTIKMKDVELVAKSVARQNAYAYQTLLNSLTLAQQRALRLAANEKRSLFHKDILMKYEIRPVPLG